MALNEDTGVPARRGDASGPLQGLRVLELAGIGPGPMCAMLLADQGADVIRVDRTEASGLGVPVPPRFDVNARSRRSVALDLKTPGGLDAALRLADRADVLIEGFRPGVAERLGLGPETCAARNPGLVYGRVTGYGQTGPLAQTAGHDLDYLALTGALHAIGPAQGRPVPPLNLVADYGGGALYLAFGLMAALFERQRSGRGQVVDAAMVDGVAASMSIFHGLLGAGQWSEVRGQNLLDGGAPFYDSYETADGRHLAVAALEPKFFAALLDGLGLDPGWRARQYDRRSWPALRAAIAGVLIERTRDDWAAHFAGREACVAPVLSMAEAARHPHALARQAYVEVGGQRQPAPAPRFGRTPAGRPRPAPEIGADTDAVLAELGFSEQEMAALRRSGDVR
jgi:alpha-methylacyl-CoA racemase